MNAGERNMAAELRAVEEGHRAFVDTDGSVRVVSDTRHGKSYRVTFRVHFAGEPIVFVCDPDGDGCYRDDHLHTMSREAGVVPCKHAALAARRLEREGLATLDPGGRWLVTEAARAPYQPSDADPFAGLPG